MAPPNQPSGERSVLYRHTVSVLATPLPSGEIALLDTVTQNYYTLNESGGVIWNSFEQPASIDVAVSNLVAMFDVDRSTAATAAQSVFNSLLRDGLLTPSAPDANTP